MDKNIRESAKATQEKPFSVLSKWSFRQMWHEYDVETCMYTEIRVYAEFILAATVLNTAGLHVPLFVIKTMKSKILS